MKKCFGFFAVALIFMLSAASAVFSDPLDSWTKRTSCTTETLRGVAYGNGVFVAVGGSGAEGGRICISTDGESWIEADDSPYEAAYLNAVVFGNGIFVAVGDGGTILTSTDGKKWTKRTSGTNYSLSGVTFDSGKFMAVGYGQGAMILTSTNGISWSNVYPDTCTWTDPCHWLYAAGSGNGKFFAAGWIPSTTSTYILLSTGGSGWIKTTIPGAWYFRGAAYGSGKYIAAGGFCYSWHGGWCKGILFTSPNGTSWSQFDFVDNDDNPLVYPRFRGATFKEGSHFKSFVIVGEEGIILTSDDGSSWVSRLSPTTEQLNGVTYGRRTFIAVGDNGTILQSGVFPAKLTVVKTGSGTGTVTSSPAGIDCGSNCSKKYDTAFDIDLTAAAGTNSVFHSWAGCTSSSGNDCDVLLDDDKTVTARFEQLAPCSVSITPRSARLTNTGGIGTINVTTASYCSWTAVSSAGWVSVDPPGGIGNESFNFTVSPNLTGRSRSANITVQSGSSIRTFRVRQNR